MIATTARSLSHNPVKLSVLILPVMRQVFKTTRRAVGPGTKRGGPGVVAFSSTHRFRDWRI